MLEDLDDIEWDQLTHAYGQADGIPARIRGLESSDPADWVRAMSDLYDALCHQMCSIYPATVPAIPFLIELLGSQDICCRGRILEFLADVTFVANGQPDEEDNYGECSDEEYSEEELDHQVREAIWKGFETYLDLLSDLDPRIRVEVPYLLGAMAGGDALHEDSISVIVSRMKTQFEEEANELVRASLTFGLACLIRHDCQIKSWLEQQVSERRSSPPVRMAAALNLAEKETSVSADVVEVLVRGLENPDATNQIFKSDQPAMESRHHPIGRVMLEYQGRLPEGDDAGRTEDMKFPWCGRWRSGWVTFRILEVLSTMRVESIDHILPALLPYLDRANEHTGDSLVLPILKFVFGDRKLSPETSPEALSHAEREVLLHLFNNLKLWATNMHQDMFDVTRLGNRRTDWARVLRTDASLSDAQIVEILRERIKEQRCAGSQDVKELRLCRIGSPEFLPHLQSYTNLKILDFAETSLIDDDLKQLPELKQLQLLRLNNTPVTDLGIEHLVGLVSLEELYLPGTKVTDNCLESLGHLPKLRYVSLSNTPVTDEAARRFMEQHPACRISR